jgi:hypothetical protein
MQNTLNSGHCTKPLQKFSTRVNDETTAEVGINIDDFRISQLFFGWINCFEKNLTTQQPPAATSAFIQR